MSDIAPELLERLQKAFQELYESNKELKDLLGLIENGLATYEEANLFSQKVGELLAKVFQENINASELPDGKLYYNIAQRVVEPMLNHNYTIIKDYCVNVQTILNEQAKIGLKAIEPELNQDRVDGIIDLVSGYDDFNKAKDLLNEPVVNFSQSIVDSSIKANADFQYQSGMNAKITRYVVGGCCKWCSRLAGTYDYDNKPTDIFRRHENCRCTVVYKPSAHKWQNSHTKVWNGDAEARIEWSKTFEEHGLSFQDWLKQR